LSSRSRSVTAIGMPRTPTGAGAVCLAGSGQPGGAAAGALALPGCPGGIAALGERVTAPGLVGAALILAGVALTRESDQQPG